MERNMQNGKERVGRGGGGQIGREGEQGGERSSRPSQAVLMGDARPSGCAAGGKPQRSTPRKTVRAPRVPPPPQARHGQVPGRLTAAARQAARREKKKKCAGSTVAAANGPGRGSAQECQPAPQTARGGKATSRGARLRQPTARPHIGSKGLAEDLAAGRRCGGGGRSVPVGRVAPLPPPLVTLLQRGSLHAVHQAFRSRNKQRSGSPIEAGLF